MINGDDKSCFLSFAKSFAVKQLGGIQVQFASPFASFFLFIVICPSSTRSKANSLKSRANRLSGFRVSQCPSPPPPPHEISNQQHWMGHLPIQSKSWWLFGPWRIYRGSIFHQSRHLRYQSSKLASVIHKVWAVCNKRGFINSNQSQDSVCDLEVVKKL